MTPEDKLRQLIKDLRGSQETMEWDGYKGTTQAEAADALEHLLNPVSLDMAKRAFSSKYHCSQDEAGRLLTGEDLFNMGAYRAQLIKEMMGE
jgi:hypothetical protein